MAINHLADLKGVVSQSALDKSVESAAYPILACTPVVKQPMTNPYRVVLVVIQDGGDDQHKFVVWNEVWQGGCTLDKQGWLKPLGRSSYHQGDYFRLNSLHAALQRFAERVEGFARHSESIYRDLNPRPVTAPGNPYVEPSA